MASYADTAPQTLQAYTLLQMAAEALLGQPSDAKAVPAGAPFVPTFDSATLQSGNDHTTRMTPQQAADFVANWTIVRHQPNTSTGFSATLFKYSGSEPCPTSSQYIVSFRSTEIIEDYVRDGVATNELEIQKTGWALGQISDMRKWWAAVEAQVPGVKVDVTGYSLGGHLAAAFNQLYPDKVNRYYTFNGAGIGEVVGGYGYLGAAVDTFSRMRDSGNADMFANASVLALYRKLKASLSGTDATSFASAVANAKVDITNLRSTLSTAPGQNASGYELDLISQAVDRIANVVSGVAYTSTITTEDFTASPAQIKTIDIAALGLDYQLAVLRTAPLTRAVNTTVPASLLGEAVSGLESWARSKLGLDPRGRAGDGKGFDVYGEPWPSAVANSQLHFGRSVPVYIEDQPLVRGSVAAPFLETRLRTGEFRPLLNGYDKNDFGDTHSIVLLADSLRVQAIYAGLDSKATLASLSGLMRVASNSKASSRLGTQGQAAGDIVESFLDAGRFIFGGPTAIATPTLNKANRETALKGNTWHDVTALRQLLDGTVTELKNATSGLEGMLKVQLSGSSMDARNDFGAFASIYALSILHFTGADAAGQSALTQKLKDQWGAIYSDWDGDRQRASNPDNYVLASFTDSWLRSRSAMLGELLRRNSEKMPDDATRSGSLLGPAITYVDKTQGC